MTIMWTNICTILQTIILISADRTGKIFKKGASKAVSLWAVCALPPQCVLFFAGLLCVFMLPCAVEPLGSLKAVIATLELSSTVELSEPHYQRCLFENMSTSVLHVQIKRICFHLQWNCSWSEIRWFADSWQMEAGSYHVPPQPATQFKFYFHASALTILSCIYMHEI